MKDAPKHITVTITGSGSTSLLIVAPAIPLFLAPEPPATTYEPVNPEEKPEYYSAD